MTRASLGAKLGDASRKADVAEFLVDRVPEIQLSAEECKILKDVVFRNYQTVLDPIYRKVADKEVNTISKLMARNIEHGLYEIGPKKACEEVIRENLKEYKGIMKAVGYDSPN